MVRRIDKMGNDKTEKTEDAPNGANETDFSEEKNICSPDPFVARRILRFAVATMVADVLVWATSLAFLCVSWFLVSEMSFRWTSTPSVDVFLHIFFKTVFAVSMFFAAIRSAKNQRRRVASGYNICAGTCVAPRSAFFAAFFLCAVAASPLFVPIYCASLFWSVFVLDILFDAK